MPGDIDPALERIERDAAALWDTREGDYATELGITDNYKNDVGLLERAHGITRAAAEAAMLAAGDRYGD